LRPPRPPSGSSRPSRRRWAAGRTTRSPRPTRSGCSTGWTSVDDEEPDDEGFDEDDVEEEDEDDEMEDDAIPEDEDQGADASR